MCFSFIHTHIHTTVVTDFYAFTPQTLLKLLDQPSFSFSTLNDFAPLFAVVSQMLSPEHYMLIIAEYVI